MMGKSNGSEVVNSICYLITELQKMSLDMGHGVNFQIAYKV